MYTNIYVCVCVCVCIYTCKKLLTKGFSSESWELLFLSEAKFLPLKIQN